MSVLEHIKIRPLSRGLGAEVQGVDLRQLSDQEAKTILDTWLKNIVILLRDQELSEDDQVRCGKRFGDGRLATAHVPDLGGTNAGVAYVTNIRQDGKLTGVLPDGEMPFHSDQCYLERPEFIYAHKSRPGDVVLWDNRCALHARTDFAASERRLLRRITLQPEAAQ